jgi:dipeptidyl aminopeptidase/acylaminoacyl peptidase
MHNDLVDTVNWAIGRGWTDPARVAIFGGSYGGYAALCGAAFTPELFCCAVAIAPPTNVAAMITAIPAHAKPSLDQAHRRIGHPDTDAELLWSRSPISRVDDIRIPLLIAQGVNDPRVPLADTDKFVERLRQLGKPVVYRRFEDEGHHVANPEERVDFYREAEQFLAEHLSPADQHLTP